VLSRQEEEQDRIRTLRNDLSVCQQQERSGTYLSHTHSELGGRYALVSPQTIVGADPIPNYPAAAAHQHDPVPQEPSLGFAIDELEPSTVSCAVEATGPTSGAPSTPLGRDVGPLSSQPTATNKFKRRI
jgi:hypothetical protein